MIAKFKKLKILSKKQTLPPVIKKYERRTNEKTTIALGFINHEGFFSFKFGTSKTKKGSLYTISIFLNFFYRNCVKKKQYQIQQTRHLSLRLYWSPVYITVESTEAKITKNFLSAANWKALFSNFIFLINFQLFINPFIS